MAAKLPILLINREFLLLFESEWMKMVLLSEKNLCSCFALMGEAEINGTVIKKGETIFIPCDYGTLTIKGKQNLVE